MSTLPLDSQPRRESQPQYEERELQLLLAKEWSPSLWRSLLSQFRDARAYRNLPPLQMTSRPVDLGMLASDVVSLPWYRTIFSNLGDVISPEILPPLELESRPVEVDELIADQLAHPWWTSLLRNLADWAAPERQVPLQLTSKPADPGNTQGWMILPQWSSVIDTPKVFYADKPKADLRPVNVKVVPPKPEVELAELEFVHTLEKDLKNDLRRSRVRGWVWISLACLEIVLLGGPVVLQLISR